MSFDRSWFSKVFIGTALIVATIAVYSQVVYSDFVSFDDLSYVVQNPRVLDGLSAKGWAYAWTSFACCNWHPLTWLSLQLDASIWGKNPAGYHCTNLLFHLANSILLFAFLLRTTNLVSTSGFVAGLFALHPLHVESVAWVSERKDVLCTFFLLLTLIAYVQYCRKPTALWYVIVAALYALGLLAKPMLVTLPILLLLLDYWPLRRTSFLEAGLNAFTLRRLIAEKLPLLCLSLGSSLITISAQESATTQLRNLALGTRIGNAIHAYAWYLQKTFVPINLTVFYPHPEDQLTWTSILVASSILVGVSGVAIVLRTSRPHLVVGWIWFVVSLVPVIGLLQVGGQAYADRYSYIPHIGLFLAIVWETKAILCGTKAGQSLFALLSLVAVVSCGSLTKAQVAYWKNSETLWTHAIELIPDNYVAHAHLSDLRFEQGDFQRSLDHIERGNNIEQGLRRNDTKYVAAGYCNWGRCLLALERTMEAEDKFREALKIDPKHEQTLNELSKLLEQQGRHEEAAKHAETVAKWAKQQPENPAALLSLGLAEARRGNLDSAISHFQRVVKLSPLSAEAYSNLGLALAQSNRLKEAKASFLRVIEINPSVAMAHFMLGQIYEDEHDLANAKKYFGEAYRLNPKDAEAKQNLDRLSKK